MSDVPKPRRMTFDEMAARAQYEWQRAEDAEAEVRALHAERTDAILSDQRVKALVEAAGQARLAFAGYVSAQSAIDKLGAALAAMEPRHE